MRLIESSAPKSAPTALIEEDRAQLAPHVSWLRAARAGRTNGEIAAALGKSPRSVKTQVEAILEKMGLENRVQLAAMYGAHGGADSTIALGRCDVAPRPRAWITFPRLAAAIRVPQSRHFSQAPSSLRRLA